jgi:Na+-transporting methylmalonyl-CoA/oxaloacetate decarboxylase gamma subunit
MENLAWGLQMTVLGMGLVFLLLALLWGLLTLALALDRTPETTLTPHEDKQTDLPADLVAAISIAVLKHRSTLRLAHGSTANEDAAASRWVATGRTRQNASWQPRGK